MTGSPTQLMELQPLTCSCWFSGTVVREDMGYTLEEAGKEVLGFASKVVIKNDSTLIVTDGSTLHAVEKRVAQMKGQIEV
jgi:chaperonin GroEL